MTSYLFVFGRTPQLALTELLSFFPDVTALTSQVVMREVSASEVFSPELMLRRLGGTVKIAEILGEIPKLSPQALASLLTKTAEVPHRITFGISSYAVQVSPTITLLSQIKQELESRGYAVRFVAGRNAEPLSSVVVTKQNVTELIIAPKKNVLVVAKTVGVQDFEEWNRRDYNRPFADSKAGMLPSKVARMVVNVAGGSRQARTITLLDPFCGMGTILAEALLSGWNVIGSDQSAEVVEKARKNLDWLMTGSDPVRKQGPTLPAWKLFVADATHVSEHLPSVSVNTIVTEPFMGPTWLGGNNPIRPITQSDQLKTIKNTIKGLENLYIGCLKDWRSVLKSGGRVVMALPAFQVGQRSLFVKRVIDSCENLGYTKLLGPLEYSRPQAVVRRWFYVWRT